MPAWHVEGDINVLEADCTSSSWAFSYAEAGRDILLLVKNLKESFSTSQYLSQSEICSQRHAQMAWQPLVRRKQIQENFKW